MKGLLFSAEMARANVQGRKTETRRLAGLQTINADPGAWAVIPHTTHLWQAYRHEPRGKADAPLLRPRIQPGEVFYQKETWAPSPEGAIYRADDVEGYIDSPWKSPLHLAARSARFFGRVTEVRCERLRAMTEKDASAEGVDPLDPATVPEGERQAAEIFPHLYAYSKLWSRINFASPWRANPWVWVYQYSQVSREEAGA